MVMIIKLKLLNQSFIDPKSCNNIHRQCRTITFS